MSKIYYISDCHFGHDKIIEYTGRPFKNVKHMNEEIVKRWNAVVNPEDLVYHVGDFSFKGQNNARAWEQRLNGKIVHIKGNHDCLSYDCEILTLHGWKKYNQIKVGDIIPTFNQFKNRVEYKPIKRIILSDVFHNVIQFRDIKVSPNHNILHQTETGVYLKNSAKDLLNSSVIRIPTHGKSGNSEYMISDNMLSLLGWIWTDGGFSKQGYVTIYQSKPKNISLIENLLKKENLKYRHYKRNHTKTNLNKEGREIKANYSAHEFHITTEGSKKITHLMTTKKYLPLWMNALSDRQVSIFLDAVIKGDGHIGKSTTTPVVWGLKEALDNLQALLITHNIPSNVVKQKTRNAYYLTVLQSQKQWIPRKDIKSIPFNEGMWDVEVENHNFFARKNGKPFITGNSNNGVKTHCVKAIHHFGRKNVFVIHRPPHTIGEIPYGTDFVISGHVHEKYKHKWVENVPVINVSVDVWQFTPISTTSILKYYDLVKKNFVDEMGNKVRK